MYIFTKGPKKGFKRFVSDTLPTFLFGNLVDILFTKTLLSIASYVCQHCTDVFQPGISRVNNSLSMNWECLGIWISSLGQSCSLCHPIPRWWNQQCFADAGFPRQQQPLSRTTFKIHISTFSKTIISDKMCIGDLFQITNWGF